MELSLKKRITGGLLLTLAGLLLVPLFFLHSISMENLRLSMHMPNPSSKPSNRAETATIKPLALPLQTAATPTLGMTTPASTAPPATQVVFKDTQMGAVNVNNNSQPKPAPAASAPVAPVTTTAIAAPAPTPTAATNAYASLAQTTHAPITGSAPVISTNSKPKIDATTPPAAKTMTTTPPIGATEPALATAKKPHTEKKHIAAITPTQNQKAPTTAAHKTTGWAIQVATFSDKISAQSLTKKLQSAHFPAYMHSTKTPQGELIQVFVGPETQRNAANSLLSRLASQLGMTGILIKAHS